MHAVRVTVLSPECLRIEYAPTGRFVDHPSLFAINGPSGDASLAAPWRAVHTTSADRGSAPIVVEIDRVRFEYRPDGRAPHAGNMLALIAHGSPPRDVPMREGRVLWTPGANNKHNLGGTLSTLDGLRGAAPLGDGLLARDGWSLIDDSHQHLLIDDWASAREQDGTNQNVDWYLFAYGADYRAALRALAVVAGKVPLPRRCALGSWFSRYWPYTSDQFRGIVDEYQTHGFPLDVMVLDMDWHKDGWTGWSWNRELLPDAEELLAWMREHSLAVTLNLHPAEGVGPHEDRYKEFMRALGREPDGSRVPFDAGDRAYMRALFEQVHRPLEESGVDFWWLDWQQDQFVRSIPGLTNLRWLNHQYARHTRREPGSREASDRGQRGLSFSRWAGWGDHRNPIHFSGDAHTGWAMLAFQVEMTAKAGNAGCFFWSHDIGGHFGPRFEEATARWVQFGALSPVLRLHSARTSVLDRRPWTYEERFCDSMRSAFQLRSRVFPSIYTAAAACEREMVPLLRPMYLDDQSAGDRRGTPSDMAYRTPHQYLLGDDLLVAPIIAPGVGERCIASRHVWFPPSSPAWFDLLTGERHVGGSEAFISADIDHVPIFARAGVPIPMRPVSMRMTSEPLRELVVRCFPGEDGQVGVAMLYEDDGVTLAHARGESATTPMNVRWQAFAADAVTLESAMKSDSPTRTEHRRDACATKARDAWATSASALRATVTVGPTVGRYDGQLERRAITIEIGAADEVFSATVNGVAAAMEHVAGEVGEGGGLARVRIPDCSIREQIEVQMEVRAADARLLVHRRRAADLSAAIGREVSIARLRDEVLAECRAAQGDPGRAARALGIGAGIGAVMDAEAVRLVDTFGWIDAGEARVEVVERVGKEERVVSQGVVGVIGTASGTPRGGLECPPLGLRASRLARFHFTMQKTPITLEATIATRLRPVAAFQIIGPFPWDWRSPITDQAFEPEAAPRQLPEMLHTASGESLVWRAASRGEKWNIDLRRTYPGRSGLAYAAAMLLSPRRQVALLHLDCGDKIEAWLNGVKVFSQDGFETHAAAVGRAEITLEPGRNSLMIKVSDGGGGWGFSAAVEAEHAIAEDVDGHETLAPMAG